MKKELDVTETELIGMWTFSNGKQIADDVSKRIEYLISNSLEKIATSQDGWCVLYRDSTDLRLWELTYPEGDLHGGGAPNLKVITSNEALTRYDY